MRNTLVVLIGLALAFTLAQPTLADGVPLEIKGVKTVNSDALIALIQSTDNLVIIDARVAAEYAEAHIEGAISLTDTDMTEALLARQVKSKDTPVLFYCNGLKCGRAAHALRQALTWGYRNLYYYALGMTEWKRRELPLVH